MQQIEEYMAHRKLAPDLQVKVHNYYEYKFKGKMFDEELILDEMNECLREVRNCRCGLLQHYYTRKLEIFIFDDNFERAFSWTCARHKVLIAKTSPILIRITAVLFVLQSNGNLTRRTLTGRIFSVQTGLDTT